MKTIQVTHATLKKPVSILLSNLFAFYESEASKATHVVSVSGTYLPVEETKEQIEKMLETKLNEPMEGTKQCKTTKTVKKERKTR